MLTRIFDDYALVNRIVLPLMSVLDQLLTSGLLSIYESDPDSCTSLVRLIDLTAQVRVTFLDYIFIAEHIFLAILCSKTKSAKDSNVTRCVVRRITVQQQ